jgi:hypothetical protein
VERIDLHFEYPDFAGLPPRDQEDAGDIYAPAGTRVRLRIHTDKAIARGALALTRAGAVSLRAADARTLEGELTLAANDSYRVRLADTDGLDSASETEYFIRLMDDRPPDVRILGIRAGLLGRRQRGTGGALRAHQRHERPEDRHAAARR